MRFVNKGAMNPETLKFIAYLSCLLGMFVIESLWPKRKWTTPRGKRVLFHVGLSVFNAIILSLLAFAPLAAIKNTVGSQGWGMTYLLGLKGLPEILISFVVLDMFDYWWHRFNHKVRFLWRFHKVHHVDTHVDVTTAIRFHPGELLISSLIVKVLWLLVWGPSLWAFAIFEIGLTFEAMFHHSNIDFSDRIEVPLRKVFVTPRFHAAHHTVSRRTGDANYSAIFLFWDKPFGTYREPDAKEMETLGLPLGRDSYLSVVATLMGPFINDYK